MFGFNFTTHHVSTVQAIWLKLEDAWKQWTTSFKDCLLHLRHLEVAFFPAGPADLTSEVLPAIKNLAKYGGVMLWSKYFDDLTGLSSSNKNDV